MWGDDGRYGDMMGGVERGWEGMGGVREVWREDGRCGEVMGARCGKVVGARCEGGNGS